MSRSDDKVFTLGSLFAGIGGLELGLEMTGRFETVWQVEQSEYCRKVLAKHWPNATRFEDVRDVGKGNLPAVDVICGGFPCQDISVAGRKAGILVGTRSGLWHEYARIVRELRPAYVVVENVSALLFRGLDVVLGELSESGYDAEWDCLPASAVGAPHRRDRLFLVAYPSRTGRAFGGPRHERRNDHSPRKQLLRVESRRGGASQRPQALPDPTSPRLEGRPQPQASRPALRITPDRDSQRGAEWWGAEPDVGRVAHGVPARVDRLRALGNAVVPQCARVIGEWLLEIDAELNERGAA